MINLLFLFVYERIESKTLSIFSYFCTCTKYKSPATEISYPCSCFISNEVWYFRDKIFLLWILPHECENVFLIREFRIFFEWWLSEHKMKVIYSILELMIDHAHTHHKPYISCSLLSLSLLGMYHRLRREWELIE